MILRLKGGPERWRMVWWDEISDLIQVLSVYTSCFYYDLVSFSWRLSLLDVEWIRLRVRANFSSGCLNYMIFWAVFLLKKQIFAWNQSLNFFHCHIYSSVDYWCMANHALTSVWYYLFSLCRRFIHECNIICVCYVTLDRTSSFFLLGSNFQGYFYTRLPIDRSLSVRCYAFRAVFG